MSRSEGLLSGLTGWLQKKPKLEDRRTENRLPAHDPAQIAWVLESGEERATEANLIDISSLGFRIRCSEDIEVGTSVRLTDSMGQTAKGSIVYSEEDDGAYIIGAQVNWEQPEIASASVNDSDATPQPTA